MCRAGNRPLTMIAEHIRAAWPRHTAKHLERGLGCSSAQAERITKTGYVPGAFRSAIIELLERAVADNRAKLERIEDELRQIRYERMVGRAAARNASDAGARVAEASRLGEGPQQLDLIAAPSGGDRP